MPPLKYVVQPVTQEMKAQDGDQYGDSGCSGEPEFSLQKIISPRLHHVAPGRHGLLHSESKITEAGLNENDLGHPERRLNDEKGAAVVPEDMLENNYPILETQGDGGLDEILLLEKIDFPPDVREHIGDVSQTDNDHNVVDIGLKGGNYQENQNESRERIDKIGKVEDGRFGGSASIAGQHTKEGAEYDSNTDCEQSRHEVSLNSDDEPGKDIPAHEIRAEKMAPSSRWCHEQREIHLLRVMGKKVNRAHDVG